METLAEGDSPEEFLEHTKLELFHDQVFCFTPKGRLIALPRGATPIDFAYAVHTDVGNTAVGCKVNGRIVPLLSELHNGDEVEIARAPGQVPPAAWECIVVTGKARAAIRRATRAAVRKQYAGLGRQIVERAFERGKKPYSEEKLQAALPRLARSSLEDVLAAVGRGEIFSGDVVKAVYPDYKEERVGGRGGQQDGGRLVRPQEGRGPRLQGPGHRDRPRTRPRRSPSRSGASTATFRCASRRTAAPCPATASSASSRRGRGSRSIPSSRRP